MLVMSRKRGEVIEIEIPPSLMAQRVSVCVCDIRGDKVRIGTEAPPHIKIHRSEVAQAIEQERAAHAATEPVRCAG